MSKEKMGPAEHLARHKMLHKYLDELAADYIDHGWGLLSETTVLELIEWSHKQAQEPTE